MASCVRTRDRYRPLDHPVAAPEHTCSSGAQPSISSDSVDLMRQPLVNRLTWAFAAAILAVSLSGCVAASYSLTPAESDIPVCEDHSPVSVESLNDSELASCDLVGTELVFPDGVHLMVGDAMGAESSSGATGCGPMYSFYNVGIYGIVASRTDSDGSHTTWWGRPRALKKVHDAFGTQEEPMCEIATDGGKG